MQCLTHMTLIAADTFPTTKYLQLITSVFQAKQALGQYTLPVNGNQKKIRVYTFQLQIIKQVPTK